MLPPGLTADLASSADQQTLKSIHPAAQTVARILVGQCSCDIVRTRLPDSREDERHLRERYRKLGVRREIVIQALERHRRGRNQAATEHPSSVLAAFVTEHARNAGTTLYHLYFSAQAGPLERLVSTQRLTVAQVAGPPERWLSEGTPTFVSRS